MALAIRFGASRRWSWCRYRFPCRRLAPASIDIVRQVWPSRMPDQRAALMAATDLGGKQVRAWKRSNLITHLPRAIIHHAGGRAKNVALAAEIRGMAGCPSFLFATHGRQYAEWLARPGARRSRDSRFARRRRWSSPTTPRLPESPFLALYYMGGWAPRLSTSLLMPTSIAGGNNARSMRYQVISAGSQGRAEIILRTRELRRRRDRRDIDHA